MTVEKSIKKLAAQKADSITEQKLFCSAQMSKYFTNINKTIAGLAGKNFKVPELRLASMPFSQHVAWTNGDTITINIADGLFKFFPNITQRFLAVKGLDFHEMAHCLYLNFDASVLACKTIAAGEFYGRLPEDLTEEEEKNLEELTAAMKGKCSTVIAKIYHEFENIINDAHDEESLIADFGKLVEGPIGTMRATLIAGEDCVEDAEKAMEEGELPGLEAMMNIALTYCRFGEIFVAEEATWKTSTLCAMLRKIAPSLEIARLTDSTEERYTKLNYVMICLWPYIKERLEANGSGSGLSSGSGTGTGAGGSAASGGSDGSDDSSSDDSEGESSAPGTGSAGSGDDSGSPGGGTGFDPESVSPEMIAEILEALDKLGKELGTAEPENRRTSSAAKERAKAAEKEPGEDGDTADEGKTPEPKTKAAPNTGVPDTDELNDAAAALDMLRNEMAEELAAEKLTEEQSKESREEARKALGENSTHAGIGLRLNRIHPEDGDVEAYNKEMAPLKGISKRMQKKMLEIMRETTLGMKNRHRAFGPMICAEDAYRPDQRFYANKKQPKDFPDMAVAVLVDQSGSMRGERIAQSRKAAMMLHDFAVGIGLPICVSGHTTRGSSILYDVYTDFDEYRKTDRFTLAQIEANCENRDGAALEIACRHLSERPESMKLMIIISDGQPSHDGYYGREAMLDTRQVAEKYRRGGMDVIAAAIGDDRDAIRDIYTDGFLDISDLSKLPTTLTSLVKKRLLDRMA